MNNLKLIKVWHDNREEEKTSWNKELPLLKNNYNNKAIKQLHDLLSMYSKNYHCKDVLVKITSFSSLKINYNNK